MTATLSPSEQRQVAEDRLATVTATAEAELIERALESQQSLVENWGWQPIDQYPDYDRHHDVHQTGYGTRRPLYRTTIDDREDGKCRPQYETEYDLACIRAQARSLAALDAVAIGARESLLNYTLGTGATFEVTSDDNPELAKEIQAIVDETLEANEFTGCLDQEIHNRTIDDGEAIVSLDWVGNVVRLTEIEPDQITEPANPAALNAEIGLLDPSWSFGVLTERRRPQHPHGYFVANDSAGREWEYVEANRLEHFKRNVPRSAKRGVSAFQPVGDDIERQFKLSRNITTGAAIQAAIAFVREHVPGATKSGVEALISGNRTGTRTRSTDGGTSERKYERFAPGTIKDVQAGMKYHAGPMGQSSAPTYIDVAQYMLRRIGLRWNMPEYMISADASNANFASTLVAESPFVKARQNDQEYFVRRFKSLCWKIVRMHYERGAISEPQWSVIKRQVDIKPVLPEVASRDTVAQAQTNQILHQSGILSRRTWAALSDLDYDEEQENLHNEPSGSPIATAVESFWEGYP